MDTEKVDGETKETPAAKTAKACKIKDCKRSYRAKGYCDVHFKQWSQGKLTKARYKTCNFGVKKLKSNEKKECLKKIFKHGLCEDHYKAAYRKSEPAAAASAPSTTPAAS